MEQLPTILQILNLVLLALFGTAGWRMVDEWRKSREERHQAELAQSKASIESLKVTQQHELEKLNRQISRLSDENTLLEQQIVFLRAQAPASVLANFDALKKWYADELSTQEKKLEICQSALSKEQLEHEAALKSKDILIEQLQVAVETSVGSVASDIGLWNILAPPNDNQRANVERDRRNIRDDVAAGKPYSVLIKALGHWDQKVREIAAQGLVAQGAEAVPPLVARLERRRSIDYILWLIGPFLTGHIQRLVAIIQVLITIGNPTVPQLEGLLLKDQAGSQVRALIALWGINTERAKEVLERRRRVVDKWREIAPA